MFTGIVNGIAQVISIDKKKQLYTYTINFPSVLLNKLQLGASVSHNGCCLTVKKIDNCYVIFDVMKITLEHTNLGFLNIGDYINIERSVKYGDEIGGHIVSGHIMNTAEIFKILKSDNNYIIWIKVKHLSLMKYIFYKGFICIDGISLTIVNVIKNMFCVSIIPETLSLTTIGYKKVGELVNIEIDLYTQITVDTTERLLNNFLIAYK
ncbi:riboflavin synthase subunit alpha [Buchnera aphidicola (Aphis craccivora)]|uniref:Riboflavin synthase n=1 Tax=Buchnera aphidicola (Aphis craccivora) TaxID=466616 RepID=A0A4D6XMJ8_9GAMM|nr:riboflavin synthase subunit alpha [Buchnera aphidicola]QCI16374.1 riboflavin synthase subunit alpha [Buchnera aphidicola (Aphis craccivora)]QLL40517.1 riboflavin synthase subunit alpha [Buchnera aphidicola (Aphis craccivore)]WAI17887.1 MAG: riboflavin synthase subunit alpha [Buchnera aphidicola (Aphis craccivora)]